MTNQAPPPVLLLCATRVRAASLQARLRTFNIREWIGLVPEYEVLAGLERALEGMSRVKIGAELQAVANTLRRPYLTLIADFGKQFASVAWWASSISERNTNGSDLFLHCCYLGVVDRYVASGKSVCIVCDSRTLRAAIAERARQRGYRVQGFATGFPGLRDTAARAAAVLGRNVMTVLLRWVAVRLIGGGPHRTGPASEREVLLRTWVDPESINRSGSLRDRYLPGLAEFYASRGIASATILVIFENLRTYVAMVRRLRGGRDYLLPEAFLHLSDLMFPVALWLRRRRFAFRPAVLCGLDVSRLFEAANRTEPMSVLASLHYPLMRRLAERGFRPRAFVLPFENMIVDKMTVLGVRRYMPGTRVYGFCHNPIKRNVLPWYTDAHERDIAPLPDKIICNGPRYREILIREHYPPERVVVGAALRYAYLHGGSRSPAQPGRSAAGGAVVLLVLTTKRDGTLEVIEKFLAAVRGWDTIEVLVKPHPFARGLAGRVTAGLGDRARVVTGTMAEALAACDVVVSTASGAVLEAVLAGKPVIRVSPEAQLDMDPLAWFDGFPRPVGTAEELLQRLEEALSPRSEAAVDAAHNGLESYFAPPTAEHMAAFLPEGPSAKAAV